MHLHTLPSSVSCKSFACHSYENCRGAYQQFPIWNAPRPSRERGPAEILLSSTFVSVNPVFSVDSVLIPASPHSPRFTDHCPLSPIPFLFTFLRTLLHGAKSYLLSFHAILGSLYKTPGGGSITKTKRKMAPSRPGRAKFRFATQIKKGTIATGSGQVVSCPYGKEAESRALRLTPSAHPPPEPCGRRRNPPRHAARSSRRKP